MRDFYPDDMRLQNWLFDAWRKASLTFGFSEYEGPIFEYLDLYTLKSGEGIVSELFNFEDRGGRRFAIRPEMTPTLARMVAARAGALPRPIKWFSIPRMCRAEKPQKGRLREFFQWNADVLGVDEPLADAEVIAVAVDFLRRIGLTASDVEVRLSSRPLAAALLATIGIGPERCEQAFQLLDRRGKQTPEEFARSWQGAFAAVVNSDKVENLLSHTTLSESLSLVENSSSLGTPADGPAALASSVRALQAALAHFGVADFCRWDLTIARGLAYYTGVIFEIFPKRVASRALAGGGRYDNLTGMLGSVRVPGVGFGMGDAPMIEFLRDIGRLPPLGDSLDVYVIAADEKHVPEALRLVSVFRTAGVATDFSYKVGGLGKQFKAAAGRNARFAVVVGDELETRGELTIKNLTTGEQVGRNAEAVRADPRSVVV